MTGFLKETIEGFLKERMERGLRRSLRTCVPIDGVWAWVDGKKTRLFSSNDYLALSRHPDVRRALIEGVERYGAGSTASRLVTGTHPAHMELEERIKGFEHTEAALVFNSGWHANTSIIPSLADRATELFLDRFVHASIIDGALLSRATIRRYPHLDMDSLEDMLKKSMARKRFVLTDGVFSMDGDTPPLEEMLYLAERYDAIIMVDDAHGVGVMGEDGRGVHQHYGVEGSERLIYMGTFGKAFGTCGAFVVGNRGLVDYLVNRARGFIFSTALPPAVCQATIRAIDIAERDVERRRRLATNAAFLRAGLNGLGLDTLSSHTHVVPLLVGDNHRARELSERLLQRGFFVQAIRPPTVPEGTARLRITLSSEHTTEDVEEFLAAMEELKDELSL